MEKVTSGSTLDASQGQILKLFGRNKYQMAVRSAPVVYTEVYESPKMLGQSYGLVFGTNPGFPSLLVAPASIRGTSRAIFSKAELNQAVEDIV